MPCRRCEVPPEAVAGRIALYFWSPLGHSAVKLRRAADAAGIEATPAKGKGALRLVTDAKAWRGSLDRFETALSAVERRAIKVMEKPAGETPNLADVEEVLSLEQFIARSRSDWLIHAVGEERFAVGFAPIAYADAPEEVFAHDAHLSLAGREGSGPCGAEMRSIADRADFLAPMDRAARLASIRAIRTGGVDTPVYIGFSPASIYDPEFCLRTTVEEAEAQGIDREQIVFSILPAGDRADIDHLERIVRYYRERGFETAITISKSENSSFELLQRLKPKTAFIDAALVRDVTSDPSSEVVARKFLEIAQRLQIDSVAEGIDSRETCDWAYQHGASFVTGRFVSERLAGLTA